LHASKTFALTRVMSALVQKQSESSVSLEGFAAYDDDERRQGNSVTKIWQDYFRLFFSISIYIYIIVFLESMN
jgi:hypothetical protein